jgi:gamma-glutamyltranspeptidase/glutathione hydrolase
MVATGSPGATEVAVRVLEKGGNAVDAAVAAALILGVIDSQSSGIGGLTNIIIRLANGRVIAINGTSRSPMKLDIEKFREFKVSGRAFGYEAVSVPTTLATLEYARKNFGTADMATLIRPAIAAAENGYPISEIQILKTRKYFNDIMKSSPYMRSLVFADGRTIGKPGDLQRQPDLARTYRRIAAEGVRSFYTGSIADEIEADMIRGGGFIRKSDLARVRIRLARPVHTSYRGYDVYSFPPPGGGGEVITILDILETFPSDFLAEDSTQRHHALLEAFRVAAAFPSDPSNNGRRRGGPSNKEIARARATLIVPGHMIPEEVLSASTNPECIRPGDNTTHISIADRRGNVVSLTQTLSRSFGAKVATPGLGFPYNSFLELLNVDDPRCAGFLQPNMPVTSDMAPTIVVKDGQFFAALGSPGSNRIPAVVAAVISNMVDRRMGVCDAVTAPRILWDGIPNATGYVEVVDPITADDVDALVKMGFEDMKVLRYPSSGKIKKNDFGGVNAVAFDPKTGYFTGVGDPRRYGSAQGLGRTGGRD